MGYAVPKINLQSSITMDAKAVTDALEAMVTAFGADGAQAILEDAGRRMGRIVVLQYPAPTGEALRRRYTWANGTRSKFKSHRHQRAFFAMLKAGKIRVPYRRTGRLARALAFQLKSQKAGVEVVVSVDQTQAPYARFVIGGKAQQSSYFRRQTRWKPLRLMLANQREQIAGALAGALQTALDEARLS